MRRSARPGAGRDPGAVRGRRSRHSRSCRSSSSRARIGPSCWSILRLPEGRLVRRDPARGAALRGRPGGAARRSITYIDFVGAGAPRFYPAAGSAAADTQLRAVRGDGEERQGARAAARRVARRDPAPSIRVVRTRISRLENGPPVGFPVQFRVSGPEIGTVRQLSEQVAAGHARATRTRPTCSSTGMSRPSARCTSRSIRPRRASSTSPRRTSQNYLQMSLDRLHASRSSASATSSSASTCGRRSATASILRRSSGWRFPRRTARRCRSPRSADSATGSNTVWSGSATGSRPSPCSPTCSTTRRASMSPTASTRRWRALRAAAAGRLSHRDRRLRRGERQGAGVDQCADAGAGDCRARVPDGSAAELQPRADGGSHRAAGLIGVVMALLLFHMPFGFVAMLGTIAMFGIIMRNSVILVDQIEQDIRVRTQPASRPSSARRCGASARSRSPRRRRCWR